MSVMYADDRELMSKKVQLLNSDITPADINRLYSGCIKAFASNNSEITDECWLWQRLTSPGGYGVIQLTVPEIGTGTVDTHRLSWRIWNGQIPKGTFYVNHHCDVRRCINPAHLYLGTPEENAQDRVIRNRSNQSNLTPEDVKAIRIAYAKGELAKDLAKEYQISTRSISDIVNKRTWKHV